MDPRVEQEVARLLLTELLAYQLASPVQWIDTQELLFSKQGIQRLIEIGPGDTLASMARKSLAAQHHRYNPALAAKRKLMYYKKDEREIRYEVDPPNAPLPDKLSIASRTEPRSNSNITATNNAGSNDLQSTHQATGFAPAQLPQPIAEIPDAAVTAKEVVVAIIASKLQKPFSSIETSKTIKQLVGGRSTLENEIVGDIAAEISILPERAEETELDVLCAAIQASPSFTGQLKKTTNGSIQRLFNLKMQGSFNVGKARSYIRERWGFLAGRQDAVLLRAAVSPPVSRLGSESDTKAYFDGIVQDYAKEVGVLLLPSASQTQEIMRQHILSPKILTRMEEGSGTRRDFLSSLHGLDSAADGTASRQAQKLIDSLQSKLDGLYAELGDEFVTGIQPAWSTTKARHYDSSWNWGIQDLFDAFFSILCGEAMAVNQDLLNRSILVANRSDERISRVVDYLIGAKYNVDKENLILAKQFLKEVIQKSNSSLSNPYVAYSIHSALAPSTTIDENGKVHYIEVARPKDKVLPAIQIARRDLGDWTPDQELTEKYLAILDRAQQSGISFRGKNVLVTGAGARSIGAEIVRGLLNGGARVIVTTSSYKLETVRQYQEMYVNEGAKGSELVVVPFNQGSQQDIDSLVDYIFDEKRGLGWDLDHLVPFAAISENGRQLDGIDSRSELAHRLMLTNLLRLLGAVKRQKDSRGYSCRPTQVVLPLSPNHGILGNDGLYAESKISLETLANKWSSESWADFLTICGIAIGWTRGTGLMSSNDIMAADIEKLGLRTFSSLEMAFYILGCMARPIAKQNELEPIYADLSGGMNDTPSLKKSMTQIQHRISEQSAIAKALAEEKALERQTSKKNSVDVNPAEPGPQANLQFPFPKLKSHEQIVATAKDLEGMVDLEKIVVITGFSEVGPYGNARTRWEMEAYGKFSLEGCVEMAWIMNLIKHYDGPMSDGHYIGWVDVATEKPVRDCDVKAKYEDQILRHTGIRIFEPEMDPGYDPAKKKFMHEIVLEEDMPPIQVHKDLATDFSHQHGELVDIVDVPGSNGEDCFLRLKKGAVIHVPKAMHSDRHVGGQIPAGWDARTYGIPNDIIQQVDRVTLFALVSTAEALAASGITDTYEIYKYLHVSELGNCIGSGLGGQISLKAMYRGRFTDQAAQNDVFQETFINTIAAWVNMLLMSAAGPIRTPVGACATSIESLETGYETIVGGKAKMCLVGGFDDLTEDGSSEFGYMKVTTNDDEEAARGRDPSESSRPTASSRAGFVESQGGGVQVITSARIALDMGLPIHAIVAWVSTASDKAGRSVPAAGKGILVNARESSSNRPSQMLNPAYRKRRLNLRKQMIKANLEAELALIEEDVLDHDQLQDSLEEGEQRKKEAKKDAERQEKDALNAFGNNFWHNDPEISSIRGALAVWGLTIDDIDFASFHGTSTKLNDINETEVIQAQLSHLGRNPGNPLMGIFQKYLTGHAKGGAGAWMVNGCLQVLDSGLIPGNRNADNIDSKLRASDLIVFPNRTIRTPGVKAFSISSFGFGQKGAQAIGVHPDYLFATLTKAEYEDYRSKRRMRHRKAARHFHRAIATNTMFVAKSAAPYRPDQEQEVLLNPHARVSSKSKGSEFIYEDSGLR
ncbi:hypothetical protein MMC10_002642 [Thelotrema lepadinum]|nr:hypothetical protein [Thelotrema lepadinum]